MRNDILELLNLRRLPAKLDKKQAAILLGCEDHEMRILIAKKILRPLGKPQNNSTKWFSAQDVEDLAKDRKKLSEAVEKISAEWRRQKTVTIEIKQGESCEKN